MTVTSALISLALIVLSFVAGLRLDNYYHTRAAIEQKEALEKQFVRLRARADADDPVRPYGTPQFSQPIPVSYPSPPITQEFMDELQANGRAKTTFRKSDLTK